MKTSDKIIRFWKALLAVFDFYSLRPFDKNAFLRPFNKKRRRNQADTLLLDQKQVGINPF